MATERTPLVSKARLASDLSERERLTILGCIWFVVWLGAFDSTLVAVVLPKIGDEFQKQNQASWIGTAYLLSTMGLTPLYGRLANIVGRRKSLLIAVGLFGIGTLLCALAPSMNTLILARFIAGCGGGGLMATSSIIASDFVHLKDRAFFQGLTNLFFSFGQGLGGPLGGLVSDLIGWRASFLFQVPLIALSHLLLYIKLDFVVPNQTELTWDVFKKRVDYLGCLFLTVSLGGLLFGLGYTNNEGLPLAEFRSWFSYTVFTVFFVFFILVEAYYAPEPIFPMELMKQNNPFFTNVCHFLISAVGLSSLFIYPMFFEYVRRYSPTSTGLRFIPHVLTLMTSSLGTGWIMRHTGKYYNTIIGASVSLVAGTLLSSSLTVWGNTWYKQVFDSVAIIPMTLGVSSQMTSLLVALISSLDAEHMAVSTGMSYLFRYTGQVVGVGISTGLLQSSISKNLHEQLPKDAHHLIDAIRFDTSIVDTLPKHLFKKCIHAYHDAFSRVYLFLAVIAVVNLISSVFIREYHLPTTLQRTDPDPVDDLVEGTGAPTLAGAPRPSEQSA